MNLTTQILMIGTGCHEDTAGNWLAAIQGACDKFNMSDSPRKVAAFLANIGVESAGLTAVVENLNYGAQGLANTWPNRFRGSDKKPNALAVSIARQPEPIANNVYANRLGNGDVLSGDGWRYRGRGLIQLTGKANYAECGDDLGLDLVNGPEQLEQPDGASLSAAWFFTKHHCDTMAENGDFAGTVKAINGAPPNTANQGELRTQRYNNCLAALMIT